ncbi:hypothetical protein BDZ94DRAFT_1245818 [Collybia nuda]|uniref:PH domain-containing protein n=1 Tax=Collybia nuda TaxID=64659 RepID=A0A9P5YG20_9AGAR|nr:hypothetical protein BDZ94DRAFT_1245818 [Collybia nuda]
MGARSRRSSTHSRANDKGKEPVYGNDSAEGSTSPTSSGFGANSFSPSSYIASSSLIPYDSSMASTSGERSKKTQRGSILGAASDALGFKFGRRRPTIREPPMPIILPGVMEIKAPGLDEEMEERNRLRDIAAISIGIKDVLKLDDNSLEESVEETGEEQAEGVVTPVLGDLDARNSPNIMAWETLSNPTRSLHGSSHSIANVSSLAFTTTRHRSGSVLAHSRTNSATLAPVPAFPVNLATLNQFKQAAISLQKYYPSSSLRIFALSKNWRSRFMVLSAPTALTPRESGPPVSYLHLFKSAGGDEKEVERLAINEDSVVFVAEEDVGGRKHVVKVGGIDVGALKKEWNHEDGGRTMWFLHITDPAEAQKWISSIKNAILGQRSIRAGLGLPANTSNFEPRGDMDVMLSIRAQGLITSSTNASPRHNTPPQSPVLPDQTYASSISSHRSQATVARSVSSGPVSTFKGLFTSTRPRSASRAASIDSERHQHSHDRELHDESFASMGSHFLGSGLRPKSGNTPPSSSQSITTHANLPFSGSILSPEHRLERKILTERSTQWASAEPTPAMKERTNRTMSLGALSLQPPPRKRWTSIGPTTSTSSDGIHEPINSNSDKGPEGFYKAGTEPPSSPILASFPFGTPEQKPRAPSIQSVSTLASGEQTLSVERSSSSTKRSSMKRWSRQSGVLPRRLTPPSGPPPSVPSAQAIPHPYAGEQPPSRSSSTHSTASQRSFVSSLPSFSKRASGSSAFSVKTSSTSYSNSASRPTSSQGHRLSMPPPPRPAPTFALPPAPDQDTSKADIFPKPSFRDSVAHRAFRLSTIAPKPPPSTVLPPRPDEPEYKSHRRNSSASSYTHSTPLDSIPASPVPPALTVSPFPPPVGPLPPTPEAPSQSSAPTQLPASRHASIKRRLRILSAPSPSQSAEPSQYSNKSSSYNSVHYFSRPVTANGSITVSPPVTPIAEKITLYQNDPSFLQIQTPPTTFAPPPRPLPTPPEQLPELTSLSPPPRRGSKQISVLEIEPLTPVVKDDKSPVEGEHKLMSLSRPGSVISLGIVNV